MPVLGGGVLLFSPDRSQIAVVQSAVAGHWSLPWRSRGAEGIKALARLAADDLAPASWQRWRTDVVELRVRRSRVLFYPGTIFMSPCPPATMLPVTCLRGLGRHEQALVALTVPWVGRYSHQLAPYQECQAPNDLPRRNLVGDDLNIQDFSPNADFSAANEGGEERPTDKVEPEGTEAAKSPTRSPREEPSRHAEDRRSKSGSSESDYSGDESSDKEEDIPPVPKLLEEPSPRVRGRKRSAGKDTTAICNLWNFTNRCRATPCKNGRRHICMTCQGDHPDCKAVERRRKRQQREQDRKRGVKPSKEDVHGSRDQRRKEKSTRSKAKASKD